MKFQKYVIFYITSELKRDFWKSLFFLNSVFISCRKTAIKWQKNKSPNYKVEQKWITKWRSFIITKWRKIITKWRRNCNGAQNNYQVGAEITKWNKNYKVVHNTGSLLVWRSLLTNHIMKSNESNYLTPRLMNNYRISLKISYPCLCVQAPLYK